MNNIMKNENVFLDFEAKDRTDLFNKISKIALEKGLVDNAKTLIKAFEDREALDSTAFEDGFAIPHARTKDVKKAGAFFVRLKKPIIWDSKENKLTDVAIMLVIPESVGDYLDILSGIAQKLLVDEIRQDLKTLTDKKVIVKLLMEEQEKKTSVVSNSDNALSVVGISACATGVVHTYMARDAILEAGKKLNWNVAVETQGQKGQEFKLTEAEIAKADAVILAVDIAVDLDRFAGKKIYKVGTKTLIDDPETQLRYAVSKGKVMTKEAAETGAFDVKGGGIVQHIMSGVSYMIPFIVFAGIIFAVVTGLGKIIFGENQLNYSGTWDFTNGGLYVQDILGTVNGKQEVIGQMTIHGYGIGTMYMLNKFANYGFLVMMPIMGAYIANSIAGRSAIAPAFVLTMLAATPTDWLHWGVFADYADTMQGLGIFGVLIFGFAVGYTVKWINTKWRINKYIKPIMPIIIIPVFVSLIFGLVWILILGNIFGVLIGWLYDGLKSLENSSAGMALIGLILGLIAGIDMGGPINKIASFSATALIYIDGGKAMGAAAASFAIAPMGCGIAVLIFRKKFRDDKALGINATILGFMGISEGAIPFAVKYRWAALVPNIIGSGIAAMFAGIFGVSGWVGAWGGPIIAIFGGVTSGGDAMSYAGIPLYLLAIAIGIAVHVIIFRFLVEVQTNRGMIGSVKRIHTETMEEEKKNYLQAKTKLVNEIDELDNAKINAITKAKKDGEDVNAIKANYKDQILKAKEQLNSLKVNHKSRVAELKAAYKESAKAEKEFMKTKTNEVKTIRTSQKQGLEAKLDVYKNQIDEAKNIENKYQRKEAIASIKTEMDAVKDEWKDRTETLQSEYKTPYVINYKQAVRI